MNDPSADERLRGIGQLPEFEPPPEAWLRIEARLARPGPTGHGGRVLAGVLLLVAVASLTARLALRPAERSAARADLPQVAVATADALSLDRRSARLEQLLAALPPANVGRASTGLTTTLLEERIAAVDERLSLPDAAELSLATTAALKRQRVMLLDSLVRVKYASAVVASL